MQQPRDSNHTQTKAKRNLLLQPIISKPKIIPGQIGKQELLNWGNKNGHENTYMDTYKKKEIKPKMDMAMQGKPKMRN